MVAKTTTAAATKSTRLKMSYEEFLQWADEDVHAEWDASRGEVIIHMPPKEIHQITLGFLYELLSLFVRLFSLGKVMVAPFEMKVSAAGSAREPDIFFVANENLERLTEDRLVGPADLIVELVSDDSVQRDRNRKFQEYRDAGVREYWIVDPRPDKQRADFFRLDEQGEYELYATEDDERVASHVLPGFWLKPTWLWQADERDPFLAFCEMAGLSEAVINQFRQQIQAGFERSGD